MDVNMKSFALSAKQRLKKNIYRNKNSTGYNVPIYSLTNIEIKTICSGDDELYKKVIAIMEEDDVITNPISRLIDKSHYSKLGEEEKERYILNLSEKYRRIKHKIENDNFLSSGM